MEQVRETLYCDEKTFGNVYQMTTTLGRGTFATVKLAFHMPTVSYVAVKILANVKGDSAFQEVQTQEMMYLIMDYASKGDLLHQIRKPGGL